MEENPSDMQGDDLPVEQVSWNDCQRFISKLNELTGKIVPSQVKMPAGRHKKKKPGFITSTYVWERNDRDCIANI